LLFSNEKANTYQEKDPISSNGGLYLFDAHDHVDLLVEVGRTQNFASNLCFLMRTSVSNNCRLQINEGQKEVL
jgi:hypothetical protein